MIPDQDPENYLFFFGMLKMLPDPECSRVYHRNMCVERAEMTRPLQLEGNHEASSRHLPGTAQMIV